MKSRDTLIRLKRFQLEEKRRRVGQIEMMLAEFTPHDRRPRSRDRQRREARRHRRSRPFRLSDLRPGDIGQARQPQELDCGALGQIDEAKAEQEEAEAELLKFETLEVRDKTNDRLAEAVARA